MNVPSDRRRFCDPEEDQTIRAWIMIAVLASTAAAAVGALGALGLYAFFHRSPSPSATPPATARAPARSSPPAARPAPVKVAARRPEPEPWGEPPAWEASEASEKPRAKASRPANRRSVGKRLQLKSRRSGFRYERFRASERERPFDLPDDDSLPPGALLLPVVGVDPGSLTDSFHARRSGGRRHRAIDIMAPRGSPVVAADDGVIVRISWSGLGGLSVTQLDRQGSLSFYYAHLDAYAEGLQEGMEVRRGDLLGYVGTTGNAPEHAPHLHFAISQVESPRRWWSGTAVNPYPLLVGGDGP